MSFGSSLSAASLRSVILVAIAAVALTLTVNAGYGLICLPRRGMSSQEVLREIRAGAPYLVLGLFLAAVGAILGARLSVQRSRRSSRWTGLAAGAGLALVVVAVGWFRGGLDFWLPPNAVMAVVGGWLGSWLAGRP